MDRGSEPSAHGAARSPHTPPAMPRDESHHRHGHQVNPGSARESRAVEYSFIAICVFWGALLIVSGGGLGFGATFSDMWDDWHFVALGALIVLGGIVAWRCRSARD